MKNSRKLLECLYEFVNTLDDNDLRKVCSGQYRIILDKDSNVSSNNTKNLKITKNLNIEKGTCIDVTKFDDLHKTILCCKSRDEAKKVLEESKFKKDELLFMGEYLKIKIPKKYNKAKIIDMLVEVIVGSKIDDDCIL